MISVYLAGEGRCELGSRSGYQSDEEPGVLATLLRHVAADGCEVVGAVQWKDIRKLRVNVPDAADARNVLGARQNAKEAGADVLAFALDRDRDEKREEDVERVIAGLIGAGCPEVIGGVATETIEAWLLALCGEAGSERARHPEKEMARLGLEAKQTADYVAHVDKHGLDRDPCRRRLPPSVARPRTPGPRAVDAPTA